MGYAGSEFNLYAYPANPLIHVDVLGLAHPGKTNSGEDSNSDNGGREGTPRTDMDDEPPPRKLPLTTEEAEVLCREQTEREYDIAKSELSPTKAGPVICGVVDRQTGKFFFLVSTIPRGSSRLACMTSSKMRSRMSIQRKATTRRRLPRRGVRA